MQQLSNKTCEPCKESAEPLTRQEFEPLLNQVSQWKAVEDDTKIQREFEFDSFKNALEFVNQVGAIAEAEGHHPDIFIHDYKNVTITLYTHKIGGLHENDFILASKIDEI